MKLTLKVITTDDTYVVQTTFANVVEWERKTKRLASDLARGIGYEDLAFLAWAAAKSAGITVPLVYDDYVKKLVDIDVEANESQNPIQPEPGATD
jgi:hypothetical protein